MKIMKTIKGKEARPLNKLTPMEYAEDFKLYLENCDIPDQRNLATYFSEFEHQEGGIREDTKKKTAVIVARRLMADFYVEMDNIMMEVQNEVIKELMNENEDGNEDPIMVYTWEAIQNYVQGATEDITRQWRKR
jgi:hypothetical protein